MSSWRRAQAVNSLQLLQAGRLLTRSPRTFRVARMQLRGSLPRMRLTQLPLSLLASRPRSRVLQGPPLPPNPRLRHPPPFSNFPSPFQCDVCSLPLFTTHFSTDSRVAWRQLILNGLCSHCPSPPGCRLLVWEAELRGSQDPQRFLRRLSSCCGAGPSGAGAGLCPLF